MPSPGDSRNASSLVYRVSGLPLGSSREDINHLLARALKIPNDESGLKISSLAVGYDQPTRQVATVSFRMIPPALSSTGKDNQWPIDLCVEDHDHDLDIHKLVFDTHFHGITPLNTPKATDQITDCMAVCGLGGHAFGSFKEKGGPHMWLRDSLPKDLQGLRILLYGYDSGLDGSYSNQNVSIIADNLASHINQLGIRYQPVRRPLVIIAHSLGGIITKQAIIKLSRGNQSDKARIRSIAGLLFFGVPNRGMDIQSLQTIVGDSPNRYLLESVGRSSDFLLEQSVTFPLAFPFKDSPIFSFFETQTSPTAVEVNGSWKMAGPRAVLVDRFSATYPRQWDSESFHEGFNRTHSDLVKFSVGDVDYLRVLSVLQDFTSKATASIVSHLVNQESIDEMSTDELDCLRSLSFAEIHARESNIEPAAKDTGNWLLESADFQDWAQRKKLDQHHGFFWIKGNPGSGKSTLIKKAYSYIRDNSSDPSSVITAFFFNARGSAVEKSPLGLFRTLIHSLCQQISALRAIVLRKYLEKSRLLKPGWEWPIGDIKAFVKSVVTPSVLGQRNLVLFIDALDECDLVEIKSVIQFFEDLASSAIRHKTKFNICLSSRYWPQFKLRHCFETRVEIANRCDIATYIHDKIEFPHPEEDDSTHLMHLRTQILEKASGIFLWVVLVVGELLNAQDIGATRSELQSIVRKVPSDLSGLYLHQLQSTHTEDRLSLLRLLQCVFFSQRPLSPTELRYALAFSTENFASYAEWSQSGDYVENDTQMEKRICEISKGLIESKYISNADRVNFVARPRKPHTKIVQFIHESVRDFLQTNDLQSLLQPSYPNQAADGHNLMKRICLNYLNVRELAEVPPLEGPLSEWEVRRPTPTLLEDHPLLEYMVDYLFIHATFAEKHGIQQDDLRTLMGGNLQGCFQRWISLHDMVHTFRRDGIDTPRLKSVKNLQGAEARPLHIFSQYGLVTQDMVNKESNIDIPGGLYQRAIHAAAANGNIDTVKLLLDNGADPEATDLFRNTVLHWAAFHEDLSLLSILQDKLSLMKLEERVWLTQMVQSETHHFYEVLALLVPENTILDSALDSVCDVARKACVRVFSFVLDRCGRSIGNEEKLWDACRGSYTDPEGKFMTLLQRMEKMKITPQSLLQFLPSSDKAFSLLVEKGGFKEIERLMDSICRLRSSSQLICMIKAAGIEIPALTSHHILLALEHGSAESASFFIQYANGLLPPDAFLLAAATNTVAGGEVMRLLLGWRPTSRIGDDVVMAAVRNHEQSQDLLKAFIDRRDDLIFPAAALNVALEYHDRDIVELVYDRCKPPAITEDLLISATRNNAIHFNTRGELLQYLLERNIPLSVTQRVLFEVVVSCCSQSVVKIVLDRCNCLVLDEDLLVNAARNMRDPETFDLLLERDTTFVVSEPVMVAVVTNRLCAFRFMDIFSRRGKPLLLSEKVIEAAISNDLSGPDALDFILQQSKDATISGSMIMTAMKESHGAEMISILLRHDPSINITENHLIAAAGSYRGGATLAFLRKKGKICKPPLPIECPETGPAPGGARSCRACCHQIWPWRTPRNRLSSHRSRDITPQITKNVINAAAANRNSYAAREILALFESWGFLEKSDRKLYYRMIEERASINSRFNF